MRRWWRIRRGSGLRGDAGGERRHVRRVLERKVGGKKVERLVMVFDWVEKE